MRIFSVYMIRRFAAPFLFGLAVFSLLIFLGNMFDKMNDLLNSQASLGVIFEFLWLEVPYWTGRVFPMATLLATLIALTTMMQSGEWLGAQAAGFKSSAFWAPLLLCSLTVAAAGFILQETVFPLCFGRAETLWRSRIHPEWEWNKYTDVELMGAPDEFLRAHVFIANQGLLERPLLERLGGQGIESQIDAKRALWDDAKKRWVFYDGIERLFNAVSPKERVFSREISDLAVPPQNLVPRTRDPDEMSWRELKRYARRMASLGVSALELETAADGKIAYPFSNVILCALGIPIALKLRRLPRGAAFFLALAVSFIYLWAMEISKALGGAGLLPPVLAAWTPNVFFAGCAAIGLKTSMDD